MRNIALLNQVMDHIEAHPDQHDQTMWIAQPTSIDNCGTTACFAGWSVLLHPKTVWNPAKGTLTLPWIRNELDSDLPGTAQELLGLTTLEADWLFAADRTREELRARVDEWTAQEWTAQAAAAGLETELAELVSESQVLV